MTMLPGQPDEAAERKDAVPAGAEAALTVTQAVALIEGVLASHTPPMLRIVGEISTFNDRGHCYFTLKDEQNTLSCVAWVQDVRRWGFVPQRGQQVVAAGRFGFYGPQGRLQFYIKRLEPVGQGVLELRFRQLCEELRALGYFEEARKRPMPAFPRHIAIVTSAAGAALQDVVRTARQRWAGIELSVFDVRVQGEGAAREIARAVEILSAQHARLGIEAVILTRGGGSLEDLWAFNERIVAEAVFRSALPIAVGVGHETDVTIAELVADLRCSTPTQAAARLVPDAAAEREHIQQVAHRLGHALQRGAQQARMRLDGLVRHPLFRRPTDRLTVLKDRLDHLDRSLSLVLGQRAAALRRRLDAHLHVLAGIEPVSRLSAARHRLTTARQRLDRGMQARVEALRQRLEGVQRHLSCVGHQSVLQRGYTFTTDRSGRVLRAAGEAQAAGSLVTHFPDGTVDSQVTGPERRPRRRRRIAGEAGLFDGRVP